MGGQRHSKNAGVMGSECLTYAERKALGFGTVKERLGKDSLGNYDDCCLTLMESKDPVITPDGYLYSKEAILENLLAQKKAIKRNLQAYEAAQQQEQQKEMEKQAIEREAALIAFDRRNHLGVSEGVAAKLEAAIVKEAEALRNPKQAGGAKSVMAIKDNEDRAKELKAFWMPSLTPEADAKVEKPDTDTRCPASGKKLRMKDLVAVRWTPVPEGEPGKHMDPVTKETFTNSSKLVVLATTGDVVLKETYEKCIKPEGSFAGKKVREKDVIELKTGGTGFAARDGERVQTQKVKGLLIMGCAAAWVRIGCGSISNWDLATGCATYEASTKGRVL
ncbi:hypothetical protein VOLCADRAFT_106032 [Volvox carteri f. nagariensis]|uniref:Nitric oxide synthase-interacting protein zinc-finger domain-containing protein n=1 Tax=Volvox carteri f. nagariensis TaxID=3068 RepID=D8U4M8_VOLCA|nr:uncharacterized protein VOLCADRAFT_106032 [Volvox carteri f. nagariensis]EFJ45302.1 hypothetical protein VOLCADRAFT_106032 [Volvox carteri f. nagariensis]|eukprot:XP_002953678.1 hypothetical protein VOLCADRAFT_106032 [Volvox carteri f. nagariensis]